MSKKTIKMVCYGPVAFGEKYYSPWEDVWIEYEIKRKVVKEGPCFICGVDDEIEHEEHMAKEYPAHADFRKEGLNELYKVKNKLLAGEKFAILEPANETMPNIYINCKKMTRKEIEKATEWYLRSKNILKSKARFEWIKPDFLLIPI